MLGLFISHSSKDKPIARKIAIDLINHGISVWMDDWELDIGDSLSERITQGIDESSHLVLLLSPQAVASHWVNAELRVALKKEEESGRRFLLPLIIEECQVPEEIG